jgi:hypothetical protein
LSGDGIYRKNNLPLAALKGGGLLNSARSGNDFFANFRWGQIRPFLQYQRGYSGGRCYRIHESIIGRKTASNRRENVGVDLSDASIKGLQSLPIVKSYKKIFY